MFQRTQPVSIPAAGTLALTQILLSAGLALTVAYFTEVFLISFQSCGWNCLGLTLTYHIDLCLSLYLGLPLPSLKDLLIVVTFTR